MAYSTGSYTGLNDALNLFAAWAVTNGWTQNYLADDPDKYSGDVFTGRRAHIYKSVGGTDVYMNLRSCSNQRVYSASGYVFVTGICVQGSTGWINDSGTTNWDIQTGYPVFSGSIGACVDDLVPTGGTYYFFATDTNLTAVFESDNTDSDWKMFTIGTVGGLPYFTASGGSPGNSSAGQYDDRSAYRAKAYYGMTGVFNGTDWMPIEGTNTDVPPAVRAETAFQNIVYDGSLAGPILANSPDSFRGNAQLAPSQVVAEKGIAGELFIVGEVEGVKYINMSEYTNGQEIVYDSDTYKMFRIFNPCSNGVAFLK